MAKYEVKITNVLHEVRVYVVSDVESTDEALHRAMRQYAFLTPNAEITTTAVRGL